MNTEKNLLGVNDSIERRVIHSHELNFTITAEAYKYKTEFVIYEIMGWQEGNTKGEYDQPFWSKENEINSFDIAETLEDAEKYLHGEVRLDGCSNWHFDKQDRMMLHGCCKHDLQRIGDVMAFCWDLATEMQGKQND